MDSSSLGAGATISHYRIVAKIGEGGMGEVYRARDTKLNRDVAIKILPEALAQDSDRLSRFKRPLPFLVTPRDEGMWSFRPTAIM